MRVAILANGVIRNYETTSMLLANFQTFIAVDGGLSHCLRMQISPHIFIGDADSTPPDLDGFFPQMKVLQYPKEKDESDLELALDYLNMDLVSSVVVFGGLEGYTDHFLGNLFLISRYGKKLEFWSEREKILLIEKETTIIASKGQTISFMPMFGLAKVANSSGLKWDISQETFDFLFLSLSNICLEEQIHISMKSGKLLAILSDRSHT